MDLKATIHHCKAGNRNAQKAIFDLFSKPFLRLGFRYLNDRQYAEDACLEAFTLIFEGFKTFQYQSDAQTEAWMKRIVVNQSLKLLRRNRSFLIQALDAEKDIEATDVGIEEDMSGREILDLITSLPDGYRAVFNLYVIEGYSHTEIADILNITEGTSRSQLFKAKMLLKKTLTMKKVV
ncbi:RNA polymerase sigma factor [Emticicia agri]|uniref:Sigma-70 family RNA polymerase sigma factor n=1 Tax=Emticicia agri TaxID=2492393 RepID=A0A4Q5LTI6_9BACT|nr:sigma-70 family RNA polymerase sigma factor [Emticicia agri]RYU92931.1 sigma-70 family RNA polymerase sigma factor [Emticicia agri]